MRHHVSTLSILTATLLTAGITTAQANPYYDPSNVASPSGKTTAYELFRTIGCPGKQLLDPACKVPVEAKPAPAPVAAPAPVPVAAPVAPPPPKDSDGDGVIDDKDKCPNTPAGRKVNAEGCELDSDGDGVVDGLDKCPGTPAGRKVDANGCELDSDGDGVVDGLDKCPDTPKGDKVDKDGCTLLSTIILNGVNFDNDSAALRAEATAILNDAAATLKRYPSLKIEVAGHTDSHADDAYNQRLSEQRARTVLDYFVANGIAADRLAAKGYGESQPVADNTTEEGRFRNRRVELRIQE
jgi:OOP family OmpA-OmpF porin